MPDALVFSPSALVACVLAVSGAGKLGRGDLLSSWKDLHVPIGLQHPAFAALHPWAELLLAAGLVVTGGRVHVVVSSLVVALMLVYTGLVAAAVRRPEVVGCNCFGTHQAEPVTRFTVWRNAWLSCLGLTGLVVSVVDDRAPLTAVSSVEAGWWVAACGAAGLTVALVARTQTVRSAEPNAPLVPMSEADNELDYVRSRTPAVPVSLCDGRRATLRELSAERAVLMFAVSETCGGCEQIIRSIPAWRAEIPEIDLRVLVTMPPEHTTLASTTEPQSLHDVDHYVSRSFGYAATPTATLLGADGFLAGGPVTGDAAIREFITAIKQELRGAAGPMPLPLHSHDAR